MPKLFFKVLLTGFVVLGFGLMSQTGNVRAQEKKQDEPDLQVMCADIPDIIIPLKTPQFDQSVPYKNISGIIGEDRLVVAALSGKDKLLIAGESWPYDTRVKRIGDRHLLFATMDMKGKLSGEERVVFKTAGRFVKGFGVNNSDFALFNVDSEGRTFPKSDLVLTSMGGKGLTVKPVQIEGYAGVEITDVIKDAKTGSFIAVAKLYSTKDPKVGAGIIRMDNKGNVQWHRKLTTGIASSLYGLTALKEGGYAAVGEIELKDGQLAAWLVELNKSGAIVGQRPYLRGSATKLTSIVQLKDGHLLMAGNVKGASKQHGEAGWIVKATMGGEPEWQRYLTGIFGFDTVQLAELDDGRLVQLSNARPVEQTVGKHHVRQFTFAPNGYLLDDTAYYDGTSNRLSSALYSKKPEDVSLLIGQAQTGFVSYKQPLEIRRASYDAWLSGTITHSVWDNPCLNN